MKRVHALLVAGVLACVGGSLFCMAQGPAAGKKKILFYSASFGFRHSVVARPLTGELSHAEKILKKIGTDAGYEVLITQDHNELRDKKAMQRFDAIVFYTSGDPPINRDALLEWLNEGGALIGIHSATDTYKDVPAYAKAMGGTFKTHGAQKAPVMKIEVPDHPATRMLGKEWKLLDEYYLFREDTFSRDNVRVLISIDTEKTPAGDLEAMKMKPGGDYANAWTNEVGKGRVFYTALGHREDVWTNPKFQQHLLGGIAWTLRQKD